MAPVRVFALPALAAMAAAQALSINEFIPTCAPQCISDSVTQHTTCSVDDNSCICGQIYTVRRDGEVCLRDACDPGDYGM